MDHIRRPNRIDRNSDPRPAGPGAAPALAAPDVGARVAVHTLPAAAVYAALGTRPRGLTPAEAGARLAQYGPNLIQDIKSAPLIWKLLANFTHLMALLLWAGGLIAFVAQMPQLGVAVWMVNLINGAFSFWQEFRAERATAALRKLLPHQAHVLRDGQHQLILAEQLVPGDIIRLGEGDHISADARLVQEADLRLDQSTLTGEAHPARKTSEAVTRGGLARTELPNLVFAGTSVVAGSGTAVVLATGMATEFGKIAHVTQTVGDQPSPLQQELGHATRVVTFIAIGIGLICFALAAALARISLAESFIFALGMIVAFVPEGMLPTVTLALALGVQRMAKRHALVKRLSAVETLGCTSVICTDKTGTLTENEMTACAIWLPGQQLTVSGAGYASGGQIVAPSGPLPTPASGDLRQLLVAAGLCADARLLAPSGESARWTVLGDPTEAALLVVAAKGGIDLAAEARSAPRLHELPFDSHRKRMTTIHRAGGARVAYLKGAPKEVLALASQIWVDGQPRPLDPELRAQVVAANDAYARAGLRVLAVALRALPDGLAARDPDQIERDLTFLGLVALHDPPRPEVAAAVATCRRAGIRIIMITGDYGLTAESIARRIGIVGEAAPRIITGAELDMLDDAALQAALRDEVLFARVAPEHKLRVVAALQAGGQIVAATGDGVNDAPALKKADIGVAMGMVGTDVAKAAADMILTDDNFASIVSAIEEGRAIYANIKKFTTYIFTSNAPEAVPFILFAFSGGRIPLALNVMQVLAVDLGTDMIPALALGAEPPEPGVMDRPPRRLDEHIITGRLLMRAYGWLGLIESLAAMAAFYFLYWTSGYAGQWLDLPTQGPIYRAATTMALCAVVTSQIGNLFAQRAELSSIFRIRLLGNPLVWAGIAAELALVALIAYLPIAQPVFGSASFPAGNWLFLLAWAPALLLADQLRKAIVRR